MKRQTKKIPLVSYLCYLLAVSVLFTGVTFSRYSTGTSGDVQSTLSRYIASYEIDDISSTSFTNANYWLESGGAQGTARTVRFTLRNFEKNADGGVRRISDVDLLATLRLYIPRELADNMVLQVVAVNDGDTQTAVTPQYVLGNLVYQVADANGDNIYEYVETNGVRQPASGERTIETAKSVDYNSVPGASDETLSVNGSVSEDGHVSATGAGGNGITISASNETVSYSVGFRRGEDNSDLQTQLYLDLEKEITFYTIDINLGGGLLDFAAARDKEQTLILYMSLAEKVDNIDYGQQWYTEGGSRSDGNKDNYDDYLTPVAGEDCYTFNGAKVLGYHFDAEAATYVFNGGGFTTRDATTTVRVVKTFGVGADGKYDGSVSTGYSHVAPISESTVNFVHEIENYFSGDGSAYAFGGASLGGNDGVFGICSNYYQSLDINENGGINGGYEGVYFISFAELPDSPFYDTYGNQQQGGQHVYNIYNSLSKTYYIDMTVVFTQASQSGEGGGV